MHMATMLYEGICERSEDLLSELGYQVAGRERFKKLVRLAALLHDVGHGPFSHAAEELAPFKDEAKGIRFRHEEYSSSIIIRDFKDVIENHPINSNYSFTAEDVAGLISGSPTKNSAIWQDIISGQLDADRMDYLLRDSYHSGVEYGKYDWRRIASNVRLVRDPETSTPRMGISEGGRHAVEGLIIARYMMFNQVYFHKTRVILDYHLQNAMKDLLPGGHFTSPIGDGLDEYLKWDDWRVLGHLADGKGGEHGSRLVARDFYRQVWETSEFPDEEEASRLEQLRELMIPLGVVKLDAIKSWYKLGPTDLPVLQSDNHVEPLSECSTIVSRLDITRRSRLYISKDRKQEAIKILQAA